MAKTSETKGFDYLNDPESCFVPGAGGAHHIADAAQASLTNSQGVIVRPSARTGSGGSPSQRATHDRG
jgi:hypothetical protein